MVTRRTNLTGMIAWALVLTLLPPSALASDNINKKWAPNVVSSYDYWINFKMASNVPTGNFRTYVSNGRFEWNNVNRELWFSWEQSASSPKIVVSYEDLVFPNGDALAIGIVYSCGSQWICTGTIAFNTTPNGWSHWYGSGSLTCPKVDLHSTAAHEFGHLVSLWHSNQTADTMWPTLPCGDTSKRSLTNHDKQGIQYFYPQH